MALGNCIFVLLIVLFINCPSNPINNVHTKHNPEMPADMDWRSRTPIHIPNSAGLRGVYVIKSAVHIGCITAIVEGQATSHNAIGVLVDVVEEASFLLLSIPVLCLID